MGAELIAAFGDEGRTGGALDDILARLEDLLHLHGKAWVSAGWRVDPRWRLVAGPWTQASAQRGALSWVAGPAAWLQGLPVAGARLVNLFCGGERCAEVRRRVLAEWWTHEPLYVLVLDSAKI